MSKTVDERVVEMRFDNKDFESNVKTTMSTLDRLKAALKLPTSAKSLDNVANAAKNSTSNLSGLGTAVDTVNARFSAMQVVGMTALSNITSAAMRAGVNLVKSFTIDPIASGFREYELQMNSIQTILANTKSKGTTMSDVTAALDELNEYADLTIYNFAEMTKNIGTFTAAGVDLDTSVGAIKGIANLGAMSSSTSTQVSTAMYQLSQALATGRVSLMDWNSVVNAGMGGEQFQNALKRTAENFGYDVDGMIKKYGSFRESLTQGGWLTAEVLNETLNQIGGAYDATALKAKGYSDTQIEAILDLAKTATEAATEVKTFSQLMDTLKEAAGSGFAKTWQLIFGDFEQAKEFFSGLHEKLEPVITGPIDAMNAVIEGAMGGGENRWGEFTDRLDKAGVSIDTFQQKLTEVASGKGVDLNALISEYGSLEKAISSGDVSAEMITETLKQLAASTDEATANTSELNKMLADYQKVVDQVWRGDYGNIDTGRIERLKEAGWEYAEVQKLVNATVDGHRLTLEDLSAAQIVSMGYTQEQADALVSLAQEAEAAGQPLNTLINDILNPKRSGRELFLEGLYNILEAILKPLRAVGDAFSEVFSIDADGLYDLIAGFNEFSKAIIISDTDAENLSKTFKGVFSIIKLVSSVVGNSLVFAFKAANAILAPFGTSVLGITGTIGEIIYNFTEWISSGNGVVDLINWISEACSNASGPISDFFNGFAHYPIVKSALDGVKKFFDDIIAYFKSFEGLSVSEVFAKIAEDIKGVFNKLKSITWDEVLNAATSFGEKFGEIFEDLKTKLEEVGPDILEGFQNGIKDGWEKILDFLTDIAEKIIGVVKDVLGIHSPSTVFFEIGKNIIEGLCDGIEYLSGRVTGVLRSIIQDIKSVMSEVDWPAVIAVGSLVGTFAIFFQFTDALQGFATAAKNLTSPAAGVGKVLTSISGAIDTVTGNFKGSGFTQVTNNIRSLATSIGILVASVVALTLVDQSKLLGAIGVIFALAVIIGALAIALSKFADGGSVLNSLQVSSTLLSIGATFMMLAGAVAIIGSIDPAALDRAAPLLAGMTGIVVGLSAIAAIGGDRIGKASSVFTKIGVAFLLMAVAVRIIGGMDYSAIDKAEDMLLHFLGVIGGFSLIATLGGKSIGKASQYITQVGVAFLLMAVAARMVGGMDAAQLEQAEEALLVFVSILSIFALITQVGGKSIGKASQYMAQVGVAFLLMSVAAKLLGNLSPEEMQRAAEAMTVFGLVIAAFLGILRIIGGGEMAKVGTSLLAMTGAVAIMAGIAVLLGYADPAKLAQGIIAVSMLGILVGLMAAMTKGASDVKGTMIGIAVAIGVMAASVAVLSLLDPAGVVTATLCMTLLMGMFAIVAKASSNVETSYKTMLSMALVIGAIGGVTALLATMPIEGTIAATASLVILFATLVAALKVIATVKDVSNKALITMGILTGIMVVLGGVLIAMSALNVQSAIPNAIALSTLLAALTAVTVVLSKANVNVAAAAQGAAGLATVIGILTAVVAAIVGIAGIIGQIEGSLDFIQKAGDVLQAVGEAIGGFVGGIVGGFGEALTDSLPAIGENLSSFAESLQPFIDTMSGIDPAIGDSLGSLAGGLLALTGAGVLESLTSWLTGGSNVEGLKESLPAMGEALGGFAEATADIDPMRLSTAAAALRVVVDALANIPNSGGLLSNLLGGKNYEGFATGMSSIGSALQKFDEATANVNVETLPTRVEALKTVMDAISNVPNEGGLLGQLLGGKNYTGFAEGMSSIGSALQKFDEATANINVEGLRPRVEALNALISGLSNIPNEGGLLGQLLGGKNYKGFGDGIKEIAAGLAYFNEQTVGITNLDTFNAVVQATGTLITTLSQIPSSGGFLDTLFGDKDFVNFSTAIGYIASGMTTFGGIANSVQDINSFSTIVQATQSLINGLSGISSPSGLFQQLLAGELDFTKFQTSISSLANAVAAFAGPIGEVSFDNVYPATLAAGQIVDFINSTAEIDISGVENFKNAVDMLAEVNIQALVDTFSNSAGEMAEVGKGLVQAIADGFSQNATPMITAAQTALDNVIAQLGQQRNSFNDFGETLSIEVGNGIKDGTSQVQAEAANMVRAAFDAADGAATDFATIGANIAAGLAEGIRANAQQVAIEAAAMVRNAKLAAEQAGEIKSPSRVFRRIGGYMGEGMIIGLDSYQKASYKAGSDLAKSSIEGVSMSIAKISDAIDNNMNLNPTIRPVMDLDEVKSGADAISRLMNNEKSLGYAYSARISRSMNSRIQNGSFDDVVRAVDRLRGTLDGVGNTTYTVNGVTYDDGSNVANAVSDLTRAMRLQRRI